MKTEWVARSDAVTLIQTSKSRVRVQSRTSVTWIGYQLPIFGHVCLQASRLRRYTENNRYDLNVGYFLWFPRGVPLVFRKQSGGKELLVGLRQITYQTPF